LHAREWLTWQGNQVELGHAPRVWSDYLELRYRLEIEGASRALVLADALTEFLKRAPRAMTQRYRRAAVPPLRATLELWDGQQVPRSLLDAQEFQELYEDFEPEEIGPALAGEQNHLVLPQMIHLAGQSSYARALALAANEESCLVGHGFEAGRYTDADEVIWLAAHLESKNAAPRDLVRQWHESLLRFAGAVGFDTVKLWLVSPSGFAPDALTYLTRHALYGSNGAQFEHLRQLLRTAPQPAHEPETHEFELVLPMEENAEMLAVHTLEQIAGRVSMPPEVVNQVKTALVEACINATEHSHSPERKIYQTFRVAPGRLTVTVASRGVTLPGMAGVNLKLATKNGGGPSPERRGWGLKLIRSLMDEAVFERVDDGTRLRMTKYF
jgi:serine/threonine-protein kinase RsbW